MTTATAIRTDLDDRPDQSDATSWAEAEALAGAGRHDEAAAAWRRAAEAAHGFDDAAAARASLAAAHCALETDDVDAASVDAEAAFDAATAADENSLAAEASELRGNLISRKGDCAAAETWLRRAVVAYETANRPIDGARVMVSLGQCLGADGRYEEAIDEFTAARDVYRAHGQGLEASHCDDRLAAALIELGRLPEALALLRSAALVADATGDTARIAYAQYRLGWTSVIADRGEEALPHLGRARELYTELGDLVGTALCDEKAAQVLSGTGEHDRAVGLYEQAIAVFDAFGEDSLARIAESDLADVLSTLGRYEEAASRRSAILERLPASAGYARARVSIRLGEDLVKLGNAAGALEVLREAGEYFESSENRLEGTNYRATLARALLAGGCVSSAREEAEQLLRSIDRATLPGAHAKALEVISGVFAPNHSGRSG